MQTTSKERYTLDYLQGRNTATRMMLRSFALFGKNGGYLSYAMIQDLIDETFPGKDYDVFRGWGGGSVVLWGKSIDPKTKLRRRKDIIPPCKNFADFKRKVAALCGIVTDVEVKTEGSAYRKMKRFQTLQHECNHARDEVDRLYAKQARLTKELDELEEQITAARQTHSKLVVKRNKMQMKEQKA